MKLSILFICFNVVIITKNDELFLTATEVIQSSIIKSSSSSLFVEQTTLLLNNNKKNLRKDNQYINKDNNTKFYNLDDRHNTSNSITNNEIQYQQHTIRQLQNKNNNNNDNNNNNNNGNSIVRIELLNTITNTILDDNIQDGAIININNYNIPSIYNITFIATTGKKSRSVQFGLNNNNAYSLESIKPYTLCNDWKDEYFPCYELLYGINQMTLTPYTERDGNGNEGDTIIINFKIINENDNNNINTKKPISMPINEPTTKQPISPKPSKEPLPSPTEKQPISPKPSKEPISPKPSKEPISPKPSKEPRSPKPSKEPISPKPSKETISSPTEQPISPKPSKPISPPTEEPILSPTNQPKASRTKQPNSSPTEQPTIPPTNIPIVPPTTTKPTLTPISPTHPSFEMFINTGYDQDYIDTNNHKWQSDKRYNDGTTFSSIVSIDDTNDDILYQYERTGESFSYKIKVPSAEYEINLLFAELIYTEEGQRVFDVLIEDTLIDDIDIIAIAKTWRKAISIDRVVLVQDGTLNIKFLKSANSVGSPKISAIAIKLNAAHLAHSVAAGPYNGTVIENNSDKALVKLDGETTHTHGIGLQIDKAEWKEGNTVLGNTLQLDHEFTVGIHDISLTVKDTGNNYDTNTATVEIKPFGYPVIISLSPDKGLTDGNYDVTIQGSGFQYTSNEIIVLWGTKELTGSDKITVVDSTTIKITVPSSFIAVPVPVTVTTPLGTSTSVPFTYIGSVPIAWINKEFFKIISPTVGRFGPDQKLYVATRDGYIYKISMNFDFTETTNVMVKEMVTKHAILGLGFDPMDTKSDPDVFFSVSLLFHKGRLSTSGTTINGRIMKASGPLLEELTTIISGLPVADLDHALNAIEFGDEGELYFTSGSHTNGGIPGKVSSSLELKENFLSAGINVAYLFHPDFNGDIKWSALDDGDMIATGIDTFAMGLRNPYCVMKHSNGNLYATDNGPNEGYGKMMTGCGPNEFINDRKRDDEFVHVQQGQYYGHPNPKRAEYLKEQRQCVYYPPEIESTKEYTAPLLTASSSRDGMVEFHSNHFGGQLRGNIIVAHHKKNPSLSRIILNAEGTDVIPESRDVLPLNVGDSVLDVTQAPNGNLIEMRFGTDSLAVLRPVEPISNKVVVYTVFPRRGPNGGGNTLSIYGANFDSNPIIKVGNIDCPYVKDTSTSTKIDCILPGGVGTVDIVVTSDSKESTFSNGYRYISGVLPPDFKIPVYK